MKKSKEFNQKGKLPGGGKARLKAGNRLLRGLKAGLTNKDKHVAWQHVGPAAEEVTQTELGIKMKVAP